MNYKGWGLRTFSWRLSGRIVAVSGREERERAVELYFSTPMSTKQVVEHLGYPTRQCPGTVAARRSQVCGCRPQAAHTVGDAVSRGGIVPVWYAAEAGGDGAWHRRRCGASLDETVPRRWNGGAGDRTGGMPCRRPEPIASRWAMTRMCCVVVPEVLRKSGLARCRVGFSRLSAWCHRVGTCPGSGGSTNRWR